MSQAERRLGELFPNDLRELVLEANGALGSTGENILWSVDEIGLNNVMFRTNDDFRELYAPFDGLLFFGDNGGGDQFAVTANPEDGVLVWDHESDERYKVAEGLEDYFRQTLTVEGDDWWYTWPD